MGDNGPFVAKPARGWLHPDAVLASDGITYAVRYIGCMEVLTSMKKLDFETRSQVAKECIARVCAAAGLRTADKKRRVCQAAANALAARPRMSHSGSNVALTVSSRAITLAALEGGETIARHDMPRVSFASGGDQDSLDFVAYVAKSAPPTEWRACYVLECGGRLAQDVIATIGQAFELRFKEFLTKPNSLNINGSRPLIPGTGEVLEDREYYNDMPDKLPPEPSSHRHPPPPPLASLAPISSCEESVRHYVNQTPPPRTPPTALLPNHHTDIFDMPVHRGGGVVGVCAPPSGRGASPRVVGGRAGSFASQGALVPRTHLAERRRKAGGGGRRVSGPSVGRVRRTVRANGSAPRSSQTPAAGRPEWSCANQGPCIRERPSSHQVPLQQRVADSVRRLGPVPASACAPAFLRHIIFKFPL